MTKGEVMCMSRYFHRQCPYYVLIVVMIRVRTWRTSEVKRLCLHISCALSVCTNFVVTSLTGEDFLLILSRVGCFIGVYDLYGQYSNSNSATAGRIYWLSKHGKKILGTVIVNRYRITAILMCVLLSFTCLYEL
jgi:hypothetical protein